MSMNLNLYDPVSRNECRIYQTPTRDTNYILEGGNKQEIFKRYISWLKEYRRCGRKRLSKADMDEIEEHVEYVSQFLEWNANAQWGRI